MPSEKPPTITPTPDGPYVVTRLERFANQKGTIAARETMALCRCGGSANKPFCDGTHTKIKFSSAKAEDRIPDRRDDYAGETITIHDNRGICAHAGRCTDGLPKVFRLKQEPWIDPSGASAEQIIETIRQCPSGALSYSIDGAEQRPLESPAAIYVAPNGPYVVTGAPELPDTPRGEGASDARYTLCRCGGSKNKPFCDGTHWHIGFADEKN